MTLVRFDPFRGITGMQDRINRLFGDMSRQTGGDEATWGAWAPAVDIFEKEECLVLKAELPGMREKDIDVHVENGILTLSGSGRARRTSRTRITIGASASTAASAVPSLYRRRSTFRRSGRATRTVFSSSCCRRPKRRRPRESRSRPLRRCVRLSVDRIHGCSGPGRAGGGPGPSLSMRVYSRGGSRLKSFQPLG